MRAAALRNRCLSLAKTCSSRVQDRASIWGEEEQALAPAEPDRPTDGFAFMAAEIVHDHQIALAGGGEHNTFST